jgi:adenylylsulfate kinase-like enzyme
MAEVNEFLDIEIDKDVMLIHGQAGSGKSTISRKIEEYLWQQYDKNIKENKWKWTKKDAVSY